VNLRVVGFGKAILGMAAAATDLLAGFIIDGVLSLPHGISHIGKDYLLFFPFIDKAVLNFVEWVSDRLILGIILRVDAKPSVGL
jgi:hypothetical protein